MSDAVVNDAFPIVKVPFGRCFCVALVTSDVRPRTADVVLVTWDVGPTTSDFAVVMHDVA